MLAEIRANLIIETDDEFLIGVRIMDVIDLVAVRQLPHRETGLEAETFAQGNLPDDIFRLPAGNQGIIEQGKFLCIGLRIAICVRFPLLDIRRSQLESLESGFVNCGAF